MKKSHALKVGLGVTLGLVTFGATAMEAAAQLSLRTGCNRFRPPPFSTLRTAVAGSTPNLNGGANYLGYNGTQGQVPKVTGFAGGLFGGVGGIGGPQGGGLGGGYGGGIGGY